MGYWISHYINATGSKEDVEAYISKLTQRRPKELNDEGDIVWSEEEFSFYNIISPPEEMLMDGSWWGDEGNAWRQQHWQCYDAPAEEMDTYTDHLNRTVGRIRLSTKYDWPINVFHKLIEQYPNLEFYIWSEGEECEAVEIEGSNGSYTQIDHEAPNCHADWVARDYVENCWCANYEDPDDWYEDCPKEDAINTYEVASYTTHRIKAYSREAAIEALKAYENGFDIPSSTEVIKYAVATNYDAKEVNE